MKALVERGGAEGGCPRSGAAVAEEFNGCDESDFAVVSEFGVWQYYFRGRTGGRVGNGSEGDGGAKHGGLKLDGGARF